MKTPLNELRDGLELVSSLLKPRDPKWLKKCTYELAILDKFDSQGNTRVPDFDSLNKLLRDFKSHRQPQALTLKRALTLRPALILRQALTLGRAALKSKRITARFKEDVLKELTKVVKEDLKKSLEDELERNRNLNLSLQALREVPMGLAVHLLNEEDSAGQNRGGSLPPPAAGMPEVPIINRDLLNAQKVELMMVPIAEAVAVDSKDVSTIHNSDESTPSPATEIQAISDIEPDLFKTLTKELKAYLESNETKAYAFKDFVFFQPASKSDYVRKFIAIQKPTVEDLLVLKNELACRKKNGRSIKIVNKHYNDLSGSILAH